MKTENHKIRVNDKVMVSSVWNIPEHYDRILIIAPGAGKDMHSDFLTTLHDGIAQHGIMTVKFNFPYLEQGRTAPNSPSVLEDTWLAVIDKVMAKTGAPQEKLFLSGKSMGGRFATLLAAKIDGFRGLILYGYPLHAPGKTHKPRSEDLSSVHSPMLFFQGSRDSLCDLNIFKPILEKLTPPPKLVIIEGADHSFKILKRLNRSQESVYQELIDKSVKWINQQPTES